MESLTTAASIKPTTVEKLDRLKEFYLILYKNKNETVSPKTADKMLALLLYVTAERSDSINRKLSPVAKRALELFYYFISEDSGFQSAVERREANELAVLLRLDLHLRDDEASHKELAQKLSSLLTKNYPKFASWFNKGEQDQAPEISQFAEAGHLAPEGAYYDTEPKLVATLFRTDLDKGLSDDEIAKRTEIYGTNRLPEPPQKSPWKIFFVQITDFMVLTLLVVAIISLGLQDFIEAVILLIVVTTNVSIGFVQEYKAEKALRALKMLTVPQATVIRNGIQEKIEAFALVPGDIVVLEEGDLVPADLRMAEAVNIQVIEAVLTGESAACNKVVDAIRKPNLTISERKNMAFMSTVVGKGRGKGIVVRTGKSTEVGAISKALAKPTNKKSLLESRLLRLGKILVVLSVVLCALVVGIGFLRTWVRKRDDGEGGITSEDAEILVKIGISLAVSVIPEGLVAVTTITMALGVQRMAKRNVVVRKLPAVETIGSLTTICSDKTGTLTEGKMKAEAVWTVAKSYEITGSGVVPEGEFVSKDEKIAPKDFTDTMKLVMQVCSLCNNSVVQKNEEKGGWEGVGDPTEVALTVAAHKAGMSKQFWESSGHRFLGEIAFDSDRKRMLVLYARPEGDAIALVKGAPRTVLDVSTHIQGKKKVMKISEKKLEKVEKANGDMGSRGLRVLAMGYKIMTAEEVKAMKDVNDIENNLTFLGLVGLIDPPRKEVSGAIKQAKEAGIRVCMITGDQPRTAFAIACTLQITRPDEQDSVVTGAQLDALGKGELSSMNPFPSVFAGVSPAHKLKIINALQLRGEICAMTGDGVNDAPAIQHADVGIAMGKTATELTKDAASIILTDDNFANVVHAVREGRRTYDNIQKFVLYLLACNSAEIYTMLIAVIVGLPIPFTPMMILWSNLIADIPPALALGIDVESKDILTRKPRDPKRGIFTRKSALVLLFNGLSMSVITLSVYAIAIYSEDYDVEFNPDVAGPGRALAFIALTSMQLVHSFLAKSVKDSAFSKNIIDNKWLLGAFFMSVCLLVAGCYIPGLNDILNQWPLSGWDWAKTIICVIIHVIFVELFKVGYRYRSNLRKAKSQNEIFFNDL